MRQRLAIAAMLLAFAFPTPSHAIETDPFVPRALTAERSSDRPIRNLAVAPDELGPQWSVIPESVEELDAEEYVSPARPKDPLALFQARYRNDVEQDPWRETAVLVAQFQDHWQTETAMHEYLNGALMGGSIPEVRWRWAAEEVAAGDGGYRFGYRLRDEFTAGYLFTTDTYLGGILVRGTASNEEALLRQATILAAMQETLLVSDPTVARL